MPCKANRYYTKARAPVFADTTCTVGDKLRAEAENIQNAMMTNPLWTPGKARSAQTALELFSTWMSSRAGKPLQDYDEPHRYAVSDSRSSGPRCGLHKSVR